MTSETEKKSEEMKEHLCLRPLLASCIYIRMLKSFCSVWVQLPAEVSPACQF